MNKTFQKFLEEILSLANKRCGKEFSKEIVSLRIERERILNSIWKKDIFPEKLNLQKKGKIFREIDFDTIIHYANKYIKLRDYLEFLYAISEISTKYGELKRGEHILQLLATKYRPKASKELLARVHWEIGRVNFFWNKFSVTNDHFNESLQLYTSLGDTKGVASVKNSTGYLMVEQNNLFEGENLFKEARKMAKAEGFSELIAQTNMNLGNIYHMRGDWDNSMIFCNEALDALGDEDAEETRTLIYYNMAIVLKSKKQLSEALEYLQKTLDLTRKTNNQYHKGLSYLLKAEISCLKGDLSASTALATTAFSMFSEMGDRLGIADVYKIFGMVNRENNRFDIALSYFENSRRINEEYGNLLNLSETLVEMAKLYRKSGETAKELESLNLALSGYKNLGAENREMDVLQLIDDMRK